MRCNLVDKVVSQLKQEGSLRALESPRIQPGTEEHNQLAKRLATEESTLERHRHKFERLASEIHRLNKTHQFSSIVSDIASFVRTCTEHLAPMVP